MTSRLAQVEVPDTPYFAKAVYNSPKPFVPQISIEDAEDLSAHETEETRSARQPTRDTAEAKKPGITANSRHLQER